MECQYNLGQVRIGPSQVRQGFEKAYRVGRLLGKLVHISHQSGIDISFALVQCTCQIFVLFVFLYLVYCCLLCVCVIIVFIVTLYCRIITISRGGFGHVYAGVREKDHKLVAIKVSKLANVLTGENCGKG